MTDRPVGCRCGPLEPLHLGHGPACPLYRGASSPAISLSPRGTIIVRVKPHHRSAAFRWLRGILIAGVIGGIVAVAKLLGGF